MEKKQLVGGQAVIEGVMMRCGSRITIAVRRSAGDIVVLEKPFKALGERWPFLKLPVLRGVAAFLEALILGVRTLSESADCALEEEESGDGLQGWELPLTVIFSLLMGVGLFILLPTVLVRFLVGNAVTTSAAAPLLFNLEEGLLRLVIFLGYIVLISRWREVERVFCYHGAEHKAVACYEAGEDLTLVNARRFSPCHARCGTNFILIVMLVSIVLFSFLGWPSLWQRLFLRLLLMPLVAGLSYEVIRWAGTSTSVLAKILSAPGLLLQRLTTREPDDQQLEVGLTALRAVLHKGPGEINKKDSNDTGVGNHAQ